jgi:hypothetical protein
MPEWKEEIRQRLSNSNLEPMREAAIVEELSQPLEDRYAESLATSFPEEIDMSRCDARKSKKNVLSPGFSRLFSTTETSRLKP